MIVTQSDRESYLGTAGTVHEGAGQAGTERGWLISGGPGRLTDLTSSLYGRGDEICRPVPGTYGQDKTENLTEWTSLPPGLIRLTVS